MFTLLPTACLHLFILLFKVIRGFLGVFRATLFNRLLTSCVLSKLSKKFNQSSHDFGFSWDLKPTFIFHWWVLIAMRKIESRLPAQSLLKGGFVYLNGKLYFRSLSFRKGTIIWWRNETGIPKTAFITL